MYFFAIRTGRGLEIDSVGHELDDSADFEEIDVAAGLVAWDERGTAHHFEPSRSREGAGWNVPRTSPDSEQFVEALRLFLSYVMRSRRRRRRARELGLDENARFDSATIEELVDFAKRLNLVDEY